MGLCETCKGDTAEYLLRPRTVTANTIVLSHTHKREVATKPFIQRYLAETPPPFQKQTLHSRGPFRNCHETPDLIELGVQDVFQALHCYVCALSVTTHNRSVSLGHHCPG